MAESFIAIPPDSTGKKLRSEELVVGLNTVHQEVLTLALSNGDLVPGTLADGFLVNLGANNDVTVAGVSTLAEQQTQTTSLSVIDDWDEADRAKVNPIVGQAGVAAGAGIVGGSTQRVTLASDDPAVISLATIDDWDESDRAKTNPIVGQAGVQGGSGIITANTQRVVIATDQPPIPVTGGGGGIQYTEGDTDPTIVGTAIMWEDAGDTLRPVSAATPLPISAGSLPLPTGAATAANQATEIASLSVLDDWDESDRAKVNPIVGQAGVQGGSGLITATTQRVVIATDQPAIPVSGTVTVAEPVTVDAINLDIRDLTAANDTVTIEPGLNPITVDGAVTVSGAVSIEDIPDAALLADNDPNPLTSRIGANNLLWDGANWDRAPGNQTDGQLVNLGVNNDVTVTSGSITADTELPAAAVLSADNVASPTAPAVGSFDHYFDGTNWDRVRGDSTDGALVNLGANNDVTVAGVATAANQVTEIASLSIMDDWDNGASDGASVSGDVAHDSADAGEPVKVGGVAVSGSASPTSVASGDRTRFIANQHGIPYHIAGHPNLITREYDFGSSAQANVNLAAAAVAADERVYVTRFEATNDARTTAAGVSVRAGFGTAAVPTASATGVSGMIGTHPGLAPGSGILEGTGAGVIAVGGAGEEPYFTCEAATGGNIHVLISYFLIDETP